eukprot:scpid65855/ scgid11112/ 
MENVIECMMADILQLPTTCTALAKEIRHYDICAGDISSTFHALSLVHWSDSMQSSRYQRAANPHHLNGFQRPHPFGTSQGPLWYVQDESSAPITPQATQNSCTRYTPLVQWVLFYFANLTLARSMPVQIQSCQHPPLLQCS